MAPKREDSEREWPEHPLFPVEEGGKSFEVSYINVSRKEGGAMVFVPTLFKAEELLSADQILERFGGGLYELHARSASPLHPGQAYRITKRRTLSLPGRPKPLDPTNATMQEEVAAGLRPSPFDAQKPAGSGLMSDGGVLVAILQMNQQSAERAAEAARQSSMQAAESSKQFMMLMLQVMGDARKSSEESTRTMVQMMSSMSQANQQQFVQMLPLLVQQKSGGPEEFDKYLSLFQKLGLKTATEPTKEESEIDIGQALSNVAAIVTHAPGAINALKEMAPPLPGAVPAPGGSVPMADPPLGSAASVLAGKG